MTIHDCGYPEAQHADFQINDTCVIDLPDEPKLRDERAKDLYKMPKSALLSAWRDGPGNNVVWTAHPVSKWSKDEIVSEILRHEYPQPW